jgi:GNAT superfamily N-acetyltransferase
MDHQQRELTSEKEDLFLLKRAYEGFYTIVFPDPDERESLENMERYLALKAEGWYGKNSYHILVLLDKDDEPIAMSVIDYLSEPNAGVIEFICVSPAIRRQGIGRSMLDWTEDMFRRDALEKLGRPLNWIIAEMNDPYRPHDMDDSMDMFLRCRIWSGWGFKRLRFPYLQPALSPDKNSVRNLLLAAKSFNDEFCESVPSADVELALREYLKWAMRIPSPDDNRDFLSMKSYLARSAAIPLLPLDPLTIPEQPSPLFVREITMADEEDLDTIQALYESTFNTADTTIPADAFRAFIESGRDAGQLFSYHLCSLREKADEPVWGMASFFTFEKAGFGGYIAFSPDFRGKGLLRTVLPLVEQMMIQDRRGALGWYIECDPRHHSSPIFTRMGFSEVSVTYRQPCISGIANYVFEDAPVLHLLYKDYGENFEKPTLTVNDFLHSMAWIFRIVYGIEKPEHDVFYRDLADQTTRFHGNLVEWV